MAYDTLINLQKRFEYNNRIINTVRLIFLILFFFFCDMMLLMIVHILSHHMHIKNTCNKKDNIDIFTLYIDLKHCIFSKENYVSYIILLSILIVVIAITKHEKIISCVIHVHLSGFCGESHQRKRFLWFQPEILLLSSHSLVNILYSKLLS